MNQFETWWQRRGEIVEAFNQHRNGESGVEKLVDPSLGVLYVKRQRGFLYRNLRHPFGLPTAMREKDAIHAFSALGIKTPELVFAEAQKDTNGWRAILVTKALDGYMDLTSWYEQGGRERLGPDTHKKFIKKLGQILGALHSKRWRHASLYFKHVFVTQGDRDAVPDIALLDLEKAHQKLTRHQAAHRDLNQFQLRAPQINGLPVLDDAEWALFFESHRRALLQ